MAVSASQIVSCDKTSPILDKLPSLPKDTGSVNLAPADNSKVDQSIPGHNNGDRATPKEKTVKELEK